MVAGAATGLTVVRARRIVGVCAPVAAAVWFAGTGYLLARAFRLGS